jgi:hypothetical protein
MLGIYMGLLTVIAFIIIDISALNVATGWLAFVCAIAFVASFAPEILTVFLAASELVGVFAHTVPASRI